MSESRPKHALFICSPKKIKIRIRNALRHAQHPGHGHDLPTVIGAVIDDVQDIFIPRALIGNPR